MGMKLAYVVNPIKKELAKVLEIHRKHLPYTREAKLVVLGAFSSQIYSGRNISDETGH